MQNNIELPQSVYSAYLETISGIKFTNREIDIIGCLLSGRAVKTIASFLSIAPKTAETHIRNIMQKLECNSREGIIDFIEKSGKLQLIRKYHQSLVTCLIFEKYLKKIALLKPEMSLVTLVISDTIQHIESSFIFYLEKHLQLAGMRVLVDVREESKNKIPLLNNLELHQENWVIYIVLEDELVELQQKNQFKNTVFLLLKRIKAVKFQKKIKKEGNILDCGEHENYYASVFELLKKILVNANLDKIILEFQKQEEIILGSYEEPIRFSQESIKKGMLNQAILLNIIKQKKYYLSSILCLVVMCFYFFKPHNVNLDDHPTRSDILVPRDKVFLNRPIIMKQIEKKLNEQNGIQTVVLIGIGGAGKTTLARQYLHSQDSFSIMWEINAATKNSLITSFDGLAYALSQTPEEKQNLRSIQEIKHAEEREHKLVFFIKERLKTHPNWILLFDNVNDFAEIQNYFPYDEKTWGAGKILITTRNKTIDDYIYLNSDSIINIDELSDDEKRSLFTKIIKLSKFHNKFEQETDEEKKSFFDNIPPFPLDVSIAAYYMKNTKISCKQYLELISFPNERLDESVVKFLHTKTRYGIITLSLKQLIEKDENYKNLLLLVGMSHFQNFPIKLLAIQTNDITAQNFIHDLKQASLITNEEEQSFSIHPSTQEIILSYLENEMDFKSNDNSIVLIAKSLESFIASAVEKEEQGQMESLVNHCEKFIKHSYLSKAIKGRVLGELGYIYYCLCNYTNARDCLEKSLTVLQSDGDKNEACIAKILADLGLCYRELGEYKKSQEVLLSSLALYKKQSRENSPEAAWALAHLGITYKELGDYKKAEETLQQCLLIYKKQYGENHYKTGLAFQYLGIIHRISGNYEGAKLCFENALNIRKNFYGPNHNRVAWSLLYLGHTYDNLGDYKKARELLEQGLGIYKNNLDKNHVDYGFGLGFLGHFYKNSGQYEEAKDMLERSIRINQVCYGKEHIQTACSMVYLGQLYNALGQYDHAKKYLEESLEIHKKHFGEDHLRVGWVLGHLGHTYHNLDDYKKAKEVLEQSLKIQSHYFGDNHTECARVLRELGCVYLKENKINIAEDYLQKSASIMQNKQHGDGYIVFEILSELYLKKSLQSIKEKNSGQADEFKKKSINYLQQALDISKNIFSNSCEHIIRIQGKLHSIQY